MTKKNEISLPPGFEAMDVLIDNKPKVMPYISFSGKTGIWGVGFDQDALDPTDRFTLIQRSFAVGFIGWSGGEMQGEYMQVLADGDAPVVEAELPAITAKTPMDGWSPQQAVALRYKGEHYVFKGSSVGFKQFISETVVDIKERFTTNPDSINPIMTLWTDSYTNKKFGSKIYVPKFTIVGWADGDGNEVHDHEALE